MEESCLGGASKVLSHSVRVTCVATNGTISWWSERLLKYFHEDRHTVVSTTPRSVAHHHHLSPFFQTQSFQESPTVVTCKHLMLPVTFWGSGKSSSFEVLLVFAPTCRQFLRLTATKVTQVTKTFYGFICYYANFRILKRWQTINLAWHKLLCNCVFSLRRMNPEGQVSLR